MVTGTSQKFNILRQSPHDLRCSAEPERSPAEPIEHWVPSRYNVRATADDGRLVLWNTLSGTLTAFEAEDRETVLGLLHRRGFEAPKEKVVQYLVERGYLVRKGVNEYRQFQQLFGQQHYRSDVLELILMASEDCNFRCTYCYEDFARGTMTPEVREGVKNLVRKRIQKLNRLHISWFGGEPLYGWEAVKELAPFFVEIAAEHDVPYSAHMTTNGYLLSPEVADNLFAWQIRDFQITLDGLPEHHNRSRAARDGSPTFETIFGNLKALSRREEDFHVLVRVNFDHVNSAGLTQFVDWLTREFSGDARFVLVLRPVGAWGGENDENLEVCDAAEASRIEQGILSQARQEGLNLRSLRSTAHVGGHVCYAARPYSFLIGSDGKVMKCTIVLDKEDHNVVGQLTAEGELELDDDRMALWTEPSFERDDQCRKCALLPNCQGISCPLVRIEAERQPCIPSRSRPRETLLTALRLPGGTSAREITVNRQ